MTHGSLRLHLEDYFAGGFHSQQRGANAFAGGADPHPGGVVSGTAQNGTSGNGVCAP